MTADLVRCLPDTGAGHLAGWALAGAVLLILGTVLVLAARGRTRSEVGSAGVRTLLVVSLGLAAAAALVALGGSAGAAGACTTGATTGATTAPVVDPPTRPASAGPSSSASPTASSTPTPTVVVCPPGGDLDGLPAGQSIHWTPIVVPDPRDQPPPPGLEVFAWDDNISGYTWEVVDAGGSSSGPCAGTPTSKGECVPYPASVGESSYLWNEVNQTWLPSGHFFSSDGCVGTGGND